MKAPPKLLIGSSPGRAEKLPAPPFSRLLKGKGGSRSRGRPHPRGRSSPVLAMKRRSTELLEEEDPVSPKVTCMGQVRIHKKKSQNQREHIRQNTKKKNKHSKCPWSSLFCNLFSTAKWPSNSKWRTWLARKDKRHLLEEEEPKEKPFLEGEEATGPPVAPPKNALLLMRCRSAPQRGSFLDSHLWVPQEELKEKEVEPPEAATEAVVEESSRKVERQGDISLSPSFSSRPPFLTRCNSEPARRWEKKKLLALADEAFPQPLLH